jgi:hypothetical protein
MTSLAAGAEAEAATRWSWGQMAEASGADVESCGRRVDLLVHSSAIEIDDLVKDFNPYRAVSTLETDIYREDSMVGNIPLEFVAESGESVDLVKARINAPPWRLRAEPSLSRGPSSNAPSRSGTGRCIHANKKLMRPAASPARTGHAIGRSDRTCGRNVRKS